MKTPKIDTAKLAAAANKTAPATRKLNGAAGSRLKAKGHRRAAGSKVKVALTKDDLAEIEKIRREEKAGKIEPNRARALRAWVTIRRKQGLKKAA